VRSLTVDLGRPMPVGLVAVRKDSGAVVEVSVDGQVYAPTSPGQSAGAWPATLATAGREPVRYVRVRPGPSGRRRGRRDGRPAAGD